MPCCSHPRAQSLSDENTHALKYRKHFSVFLRLKLSAVLSFRVSRFIILTIVLWAYSMLLMFLQELAAISPQIGKQSQADYYLLLFVCLPSVDIDATRGSLNWVYVLVVETVTLHFVWHHQNQLQSIPESDMFLSFNIIECCYVTFFVFLLYLCQF